MHPVGQDILLPVAATQADGRPAFQLDDPQAHRDGLPILAYHAAAGLGRLLQAGLRSRLGGDAPHRTVFSAHHAVVLKTMALEGRGIAWLPRSLVAAELRSGQLALAGGDDWALDVQIRLYRQPGEMTASAEALWSLVNGGAGG